MVLIVVSINHDLEQMQTTRGQIYEISHEQGKITEIRAHFLALNARAKEIQSNNLTHKYFETQADYSNSMIQPLRSALSDLSMVDIMELESAMKQLPELVEFPTYSILDIKFVSSNLHFGMTSEQILECLDGQPSQGLMEWWLSHVS